MRDQKIIKLIRLYTIFNGCILAAGLLFLVFYDFFNELASKYSVCFIHNVLHLYCPGCGGTRAFILLLTGHPIQSFLANPVFVYLVPTVLFYEVKAGYAAYKNEYSVYEKTNTYPLVFLPVLLLSTAVVRNVLMVVWGVDFLGDLVQYWH